jgi:prefoldin alpha subunit
MANEKLNEKYILYQLLGQNLESLKQQLEIVGQQLVELKSTSLSVEDLERAGEKNEIFLPLGSACFCGGMVTDSRKILVGVGAGVFLEKGAKEAKSFIERNFKELEKAGAEIEEQLKSTAGQMNELAAEIQELAHG